MVRVEATEGITVKPSKRRGVERERTFRVVGRSVQERIDEGRETCAEVFEDEEAA
jgi:hypothetical protein